MCDGNNGTPDLRSRFVYGAGGDINTKSSFSSGWNNVNGHWPVEWIGGEEQHKLTIAEMPSHNHSFTGDPTGGWNGFTNGQAVLSDRTYTGYFGHNDYAGGDQPHNILPRFMTLAYIMKI